jgi:hypothetical protein
VVRARDEPVTLQLPQPLHPAVALGLVHPTVVILFGPRDERELELIWRLVQVSHAFASGTDQAA